jgi:predicted TIM-barrel fold metal-dependent hydrolase
MADYRVISSDNHVMEPPDLWTDRIDAKFRERAPATRREEDGDGWYCDGLRITTGFGFGGSQTGRRFDAPEKLTAADLFENVRPGGYIPEEQVKDMDLDGVDMSILYPTLGLNLYKVPDTILLNAVFRTYNDWLAEFCNASPSRLKGIAMINLDDIGVAVAELERCPQDGADWSHDPGLPSGGYEVRLPGVRAFLGCVPRPGHALGPPCGYKPVRLG